MKKKGSKKRNAPDESRREYDFSKLGNGVRGKYAARYRAGTNLVLLSPDVAEHFPDDQSGESSPAAADSRGEILGPARSLSYESDKTHVQKTVNTARPVQFPLYSYTSTRFA